MTGTALLQPLMAAEHPQVMPALLHLTARTGRQVTNPVSQGAGESSAGELPIPAPC